VELERDEHHGTDIAGAENHPDATEVSHARPLASRGCDGACHRHYPSSSDDFGAGYIGAVMFVTLKLHASTGQVLLVLAAGSRLSAYIGATVGETAFCAASGSTARSASRG